MRLQSSFFLKGTKLTDNALSLQTALDPRTKQEWAGKQNTGLLVNDKHLCRSKGNKSKDQ